MSPGGVVVLILRSASTLGQAVLLVDPCHLRRRLRPAPLLGEEKKSANAHHRGAKCPGKQTA